MYTYVFGLYHDQTFSKVFLEFLMYLSKSVKFDYPKLIVDTMCEKLSKFNTSTSFRYQAYLMYLILDKYSIHFQSLLEPEQLTPYDVISVIHRASLLRDPTHGFSQFVNEFASRVYYFCWSNWKLSLMSMVKVEEAPWVQQAQKMEDYELAWVSHECYDLAWVNHGRRMNSLKKL